MYIFFKSDGSINQTSFTEIINQNNNEVNAIFVHYPNLTNLNIVSGIFTLPTGKKTIEIGTFTENYEYEEGKYADGFVIPITQDETLYEGIVLLTISVKGSALTNAILYTYRVKLTINASVVDDEVTSISIAQYQYLLDEIAQRDNNSLQIIVNNNGSATLESLMNNGVPYILKFNNQYYVVRIQETHTGYGVYEIESLTSKGRWVQTDANLATTFLNATGSSYEEDYLLAKDLQNEIVYVFNSGQNYGTGTYDITSTQAAELLAKKPRFICIRTSGSLHIYADDGNGWSSSGAIFYRINEQLQSNGTFSDGQLSFSGLNGSTPKIYVTIQSINLQTKLTFDDTPTEDSTNPVTSGGVYTELAKKLEIVTFSPSDLVANKLYSNDAVIFRLTGYRGVYIGKVDTSIGGHTEIESLTDNRRWYKPTVVTSSFENFMVDDNRSDYAMTAQLESGLAGKQDTLISGTNIKTINGQSILGSGNIAVLDNKTFAKTDTIISKLYAGNNFIFNVTGISDVLGELLIGKCDTSGSLHVEIESLSTGKRWYAEGVSSSITFEQLLINTYRQDYALKNETILQFEYFTSVKISQIMSDTGSKPFILKLANATNYFFARFNDTTGGVVFEIESFASPIRYYGTIASADATTTELNDVMSNTYKKNYALDDDLTTLADRIPPAPNTNGNYQLCCTVTNNGESKVYAWIQIV